MFTTTIEWYKPTEKLPEKSGKYLVYYGSGIMSMDFSKKHDMFNASDWDTVEEACKTAIKAWLWAYFPEFPEDESEGE